MLHDLLKPHVYLEVGVQYGLSLDLAVHSEQAWGVDPEPLVEAKGNQIIVPYRSDLALSGIFSGPRPEHVDLAFIDGSHLYEDAMKDFANINALCGPQSVVVFDDVLPYNRDIASREPLPGDWTGDVWKCYYILATYASKVTLVDTFPTGTMVVWGFPYEPVKLQKWLDYRVPLYLANPVPDDVINRHFAREPSWVIDHIREDLCVSQ